MKVMIIGANGSIGQQLVSGFLHSGIDILAVSTLAMPAHFAGKLTYNQIERKETDL